MDERKALEQWGERIGYLGGIAWYRMRHLGDQHDMRTQPAEKSPPPHHAVLTEPQGDTERGLVSRFGPVEIDWPRTLGYYSGIALATAFELIEPPLAIFIAAIPLFKMLNRPKASLPTRLIAHFMDGTAKPVGGGGTSTIRLVTPDAPQGTNRGEGD